MPKITRVTLRGVKNIDSFNVILFEWPESQAESQGYDGSESYEKFKATPTPKTIATTKVKVTTKSQSTAKSQSKLATKAKNAMGTENLTLLRRRAELILGGVTLTTT